MGGCVLHRCAAVAAAATVGGARYVEPAGQQEAQREALEQSDCYNGMCAPTVQTRVGSTARYRTPPQRCTQPACVHARVATPQSPEHLLVHSLHPVTLLAPPV